MWEEPSSGNGDSGEWREVSGKKAARVVSPKPTEVDAEQEMEVARKRVRALKRKLKQIAVLEGKQSKVCQALVVVLNVVCPGRETRP